MAHNMSPDETRAFLMHGTRTGKIATVREDGRPHVAPIWFVLDGDAPVFMTYESSVKGRNIRHNAHVSLTVDDQQPPYSFVIIEGEAEILEVSPEERLRWATAIGGRYMGADRAEEYGQRNGVPGELVVRLRPTKIIAQADVSD